MHKGKYFAESARKQPKKATLTHDTGHMGKAPTPSRPQQVPDAFARKRPPTGR